MDEKSNLSWGQRVNAKRREIEQREEDDLKLIATLARHLTDNRAESEGTTKVEGRVITKFCDGHQVFDVRVEEGEILVGTILGVPQAFTDVDQALDCMAELMARTILQKPVKPRPGP